MICLFNLVSEHSRPCTVKRSEAWTHGTIGLLSGISLATSHMVAYFILLAWQPFDGPLALVLQSICMRQIVLKGQAHSILCGHLRSCTAGRVAKGHHRQRPVFTQGCILSALPGDISIPRPQDLGLSWQPGD